MPSLNAETIETLIDRYLTGDLDAPTMEQVRAYLDADPGRRGVMAAVRTVIRGEPFGHPPVDTQALRQALLARLDALPRQTLETRDTGVPVSVPADVTALPPGSALSWQRRRPQRRWWYAAAGLAAGVIAVASVWSIGTTARKHYRHAPTLSYTTGNGERANITLPDGSTVALNVASRLEVPADYLAGNHTLHLTGEALFTVRHHVGAPLVIEAGGTSTQVLGTSFLVRHYTADSTTIVAVRDGKVNVRAGTTRTAVLAAAEQMSVGKHHMQIGQADLAQFSFAAGKLTLTGGFFVDAIPDLDRWYDADIRLGDSSLATRRLTGECAAGSLADLTELLEGTYNVRVVRHGRVLTLYRR